MGGNSGSSAPPPGGARRALRSEFHLACVDGPDTGILVPIPALLGRSDELHLLDPALSREHASIASTPGRRPRIEVIDLGSMNGSTIIRRGRARPLHPDRPRRLRRGDRLKCGQDLFELRRRPPSLIEEARPRPGRRLLALLPFASLLLLGARFLTTGASTGGFAAPSAALLLIPLLLLLLVRGRNGLGLARDDESGTALHLARMAAAHPSPSADRLPAANGTRTALLPFQRGGGEEPIRIRRPAKRRAPRILPAPLLDCGSPSSPRSIGVIGAEGAADASRLAAALLRGLGGGLLILPDGARKAFGREGAVIEVIDSGAEEVAPAGPRGSAPRPEPQSPGGDAQALPRWRIVAAPSIRELPEWCEQVLPASGRPLSPLWWEQFAADDPDSLLPSVLGLAELLTTADPPPPYASLAAPVGRDAHGAFVLDLVADGPHALVAGTTGSGKSEALLTWIRGICALHSPEEVRFILFDYKGGSAFGPLAGLEHVDRVLTDLDASLSARALRALSSLLSRRERELNALGLPDYAAWVRAYEQGRVESIAPRIVIVIDELRALVDSHENGIRSLMRLAAQGRSLGLHLIAATQRPAGAVNAEMRANLELRIALRCLSPADSIDVVSSGAAAELERTPGRAIIASRGMIQFAVSSGREAVLGAREAPTRLPWAPHPPAAPGPRELRAAQRRVEDSPGDSGSRGPRPRVIGLGLVDGIDEGEHRLLPWDGGWIALAAPATEEGLVSEEAVALGARIAGASGLPLHVCAPAAAGARRSSPARRGPGASAGMRADPQGPRRGFGASTWIPAESGEDAALLLHEARSPGVLVVADLERTRRAMEASFGPLAAERLWAEGLDSLAAAGGVLVCGAAGVRANDPVVSRCSMRFERPDPHGPQMRGAPSPRILGPRLWTWREEEQPRIVALVDSEAVKALRAGSPGPPPGAAAEGAGLPDAGPALVRSWEEALGEYGFPHQGVEGGGSGGAPGALILIGPRWVPLEEAFAPGGRSPASPFDSPWVLDGDEGNLEEALIEKARLIGANPPRIESRGPESWTRPDPAPEANWVLIGAAPERLRSLTRGAPALPVQYSGRISGRGAGVARIGGRWTRIRFLAPPGPT